MDKNSPKEERSPSVATSVSSASPTSLKLQETTKEEKKIQQFDFSRFLFNLPYLANE